MIAAGICSRPTCKAITCTRLWKPRLSQSDRLPQVRAVRRGCRPGAAGRKSVVTLKKIGRRRHAPRRLQETGLPRASIS